MEVMEALRTRRSVRQWTSEPIPDAQLKRLVEAAASAPSGGNSQPWAFIISREPARLKQLRAVSPGISGKPFAVVVVCLDRRRGSPDRSTVDYDMDLLSLGAAVENLLLAAHDEGLGACPIGSFHVPSVSSILSLPGHLEPKLLVVIGHSTLRPAAPGLRPLSETCFFEAVGQTDEQ